MVQDEDGLVGGGEEIRSVATNGKMPGSCIPGSPSPKQGSVTYTATSIAGGNVEVVQTRQGAIISDEGTITPMLVAPPLNTGDLAKLGPLNQFQYCSPIIQPPGLSIRKRY